MSVEVSIEPTEDRDQRDVFTLGQQISRITQERGSFADLTEAKLEAQAASENDDGHMEVDQPPEEGEAAEREPSFDDLRAQLAGRVATALNESALNLDFVSLLVSVSRPQAGVSSMSPMLKSQIPPGTLNAETVESPVPSVPLESAYGWKANAYKRAAEHLSFASSRLQKEVSKETTFWRDILTTTRHGEIVNRKMNVRYGYGDSGSMYFDKGWGKLVSDDDSGHVVLVPNHRLQDQYVRVSIYANSKPLDSTEDTPVQTPETEKLVGQFALTSLARNTAGLSEPVRSIRIERDRLFEHELMYQLIQEARRDLAPHKVRLVDGKIVCELFDGKIEIELVPSAELEGCGVDRWGPAGALCYCLHLLLTEHYKAVLEKRQSHPAPLSSSKRGTPSPPAILKPALAHIHLSILVSRTVRLVQLMLPGSKQETVEAETPKLEVAPHRTISIEYGGRALELRLNSPIFASEEPVFKVKVLGPEEYPAEFYDLTELELWLKWVTK